MITEFFACKFALRRWPENASPTHHFCRLSFRCTPCCFIQKNSEKNCIFYLTQKIAFNLVWTLQNTACSMYSVACRLTFFSPTVKYNFKLYIIILSQYILNNMEQTILLVCSNNQAQTCLIPFVCGSGTSLGFI